MYWRKLVAVSEEKLAADNFVGKKVPILIVKLIKSIKK